MNGKRVYNFATKNTRFFQRVPSDIRVTGAVGLVSAFSILCACPWVMCEKEISAAQIKKVDNPDPRSFAGPEDRPEEAGAAASP